MISLLRKFPIIQKYSLTQESKSNECTATLECDKSLSKVSNNSKNTPFTPKSNTNENTAILEYDEFTSKVTNNCDTSSSNTKSNRINVLCRKNVINLLPFQNRNQMNILHHLC